MKGRPLRWWLRWPLAAATAALLAVYEHTAYRTIDLPTLPGGVQTFLHDGRLTLRCPASAAWWELVAPSSSWSFSWDRRGGGWWVQIPLIAFVIPLAAATAWAWWPRRTPPPGRCPACGYDRAGLEEGAVCPECGKGSGPPPAPQHGPAEEQRG